MLDKLPIPALKKISKHLKAEELAACVAVCRHCRDVFGDDDLWKPRCNEDLEETLRTTPCVVEPPFVCPEDSESLSPIGRWRLAYMRERHLWNNWRRDNHKVAVEKVDDSIFYYDFISHDLILKVFERESDYSLSDNLEPPKKLSISLFTVKHYPPSLLKEITIENEGWLNQTCFLNNTLLLFFDKNCFVFTFDMNSESVLDFKYKISLPIIEFPEENPTDVFPNFKVNTNTILGITIDDILPVRAKLVSDTLHIWDIKEGTELKAENSPKDKPFGFSDIITSPTTENVVVVVSNDVNCGDNILPCAQFEPLIITYYVHLYSTVELSFLPFVESFEAEHRKRYQCKLHYDFVAIANGGVLKIYNYQSHSLLTTIDIHMSISHTTMNDNPSYLVIIEDCFAFLDSNFDLRMFHPESRTLEVSSVNRLWGGKIQAMNGSLIKMTGTYLAPTIWKIGRHDQLKICQVSEHSPDFTFVRQTINKSSTRALNCGFKFGEELNNLITNFYQCIYYW